MLATVADDDFLPLVDTSSGNTAAVQEAIHEEPAAIVDGEVSQIASDMQWADNVEAQVLIGDFQNQQIEGAAVLRAMNNERAHEETEMPPEEVYILRFGCNDTEGFRRMILDGPQFRICREIAGHPFVLPDGALIFVKPAQYRDTCQALNGRELHPFHVVITSSFEGDLQDALASLPYKKRPREKKHHRQVLDLPMSVPDNSSDGPLDQDEKSDYDLVCKRTFLCIAPRLKSACDVVQSSTEVVGDSSTHYGHLRGLNPRRLVLSDLD